MTEATYSAWLYLQPHEDFDELAAAVSDELAPGVGKLTIRANGECDAIEEQSAGFDRLGPVLLSLTSAAPLSEIDLSHPRLSLQDLLTHQEAADPRLVEHLGHLGPAAVTRARLAVRAHRTDHEARG